MTTFGKKFKKLMPALSPHDILPPSSAQEGRQASVIPRSRMQGSLAAGFTSGCKLIAQAAFHALKPRCNRSMALRPGGARSRLDPLRGAARTGCRRNFIQTDAQALPRSAPHPLASAGRCLTSTGAGCGGRANWRGRFPFSPSFSQGEKVVAERPDEGVLSR